MIGAGVSGLVAARVLTEVGHDVVLYEERADVGGVWSASRRYPDVSTQDDRESYAYSDAPMPDEWPLHPTGVHVQEYLAGYAARHDLVDRIRLETTVVAVEPAPGRGWTVRSRGRDGTEEVEHVDHLVMANGVYSRPHVPDWPGLEAFVAAGGAVVEPSSVGDGSLFDGRDVVVVGWGKSACDVAVAASRRAASVTLVARELWWKYPKVMGRRLTFKHLLLTRGGERLLAPAPSGLRGWLARLPTVLPRRLLLPRLVRRVAAELGLDELDLRPTAGFASSNSLVTEGFFDAVRSGAIRVLRRSEVTGLSADDGRATVHLADGRALAADLVVPATGFEQVLDVFPPAVQERLLETDGSLLLDRQVLPLDVADLSFVGWSQSYRSPLTAEVQAWWLAGVLGEAVPLPSPEARRRRAHAYQLTHARSRTNAAAQVPSTSIGELDLMLGDLGLRLPRRVRWRQQLQPMRPADYAYVLPRLRARLVTPPARGERPLQEAGRPRA